MYICTHYHFICKALNSIQGCGLDGVIIEIFEYNKFQSSQVLN